MAKDKPNLDPKTTTPEPTPAQIRRYNELRDSGKNPIEAKRIIRAEAEETGNR